MRADAAEAVAAGGDVRPLKWTSMSSQWRKASRDFAMRFGIGFAEAGHGFVGEHDAPAERARRR